MRIRMRMRMNMVAMPRWLDHFVAGGEIRRTAEVRIRKISIGQQHAKSACISERSEAFSPCCPREIFPERLRCDLIFWLLFDQAKSSINYNKRKKNQNQNVNENEYGSDASLVEPLRGRMGKFPNGFVPIAKPR